MARTSSTRSHDGISTELDFTGKLTFGDMNNKTIWSDAHDGQHVTDSGSELDHSHRERRDGLTNDRHRDHDELITVDVAPVARDMDDVTSATKATSLEPISSANVAASSANVAALSTSAASVPASILPVTIAAASGYPDASNTGVAAGAALTAYNGTLRVTNDNAVIQNMVITGNVVIDADNVTMKNCIVLSTDDFNAVTVLGNGFTLMDSEIDGKGRTAQGINGNGTFLRNNIHGAENGINVTGQSLIQDNYIHGLANRNGSPHYDGIQLDGGHDIKILHNTIINENTQTAAVMIDNYWDGLSNITVDGNRMLGGCYALYIDGRFSGGYVDDASIRITNNQADNGYYGDFVFYGEDPVFYGNTNLAGVLSAGQDPDPNPTPNPTPGGVVKIIGTAGNDTLPQTGQSNTGNEIFQGLGGNDIIEGGKGSDKNDGGSGTDTASYVTSSAAVSVDLQSGAGTSGDAKGDTFVSIENLTGSQYADTLRGTTGNNVLNGGVGVDKLFGGAGLDTLIGGKGRDTLQGDAGNDRLTGGLDADKFVFARNQVSNSNLDNITDFGTDDVLVFDVTTGSTGSLAASEFRLGTKALDANDHFIFDKSASHHTLYFDPDGNGAGAKVALAVFTNDFNLTASDFLLI
jgi:Ca2+-binding RTX toxin-like protein